MGGTDMECKHNWVETERRLTMKCKKCGEYAKLGELTLANDTAIDKAPNLAEPLGIEKVSMPFYDGEKTVHVQVNKEDIAKQIRKTLYKDIFINNFN